MNLYITDKTGSKFFKSNVSALWSSGEVNNLTRHLNAIKSHHPAYAKVAIDAETAELVKEYEAGEEVPVENMTDDELLAELADIGSILGIPE